MEASQSSNQPLLVFSKDGREYRYVLSPTDYLDLLRAVDREGPPKLGVAWTLLQRFAMVYPLYQSLSTFVRAYAQPINPRWFPQGQLHLDRIKRLNGNLSAIAKENEQAALRVKWANATMPELSNDTKRIVGSIWAGVLSPIPTSSHYAAPLVGRQVSIQEAERVRQQHASSRGWVAIDYGDPRTSNWFYSESTILGVRVTALLGAATIAVSMIAIIYTSAAGYLLLSMLRKVV